MYLRVCVGLLVDQARDQGIQGWCWPAGRRTGFCHSRLRGYSSLGLVSTHSGHCQCSWCPGASACPLMCELGPRTSSISLVGRARS